MAAMLSATTTARKMTIWWSVRTRIALFACGNGIICRFYPIATIQRPRAFGSIGLLIGPISNFLPYARGPRIWCLEYLCSRMKIWRTRATRLLKLGLFLMPSLGPILKTIWN
ncbi:hypothetical protein LB506_010047 [Fusarium annulatum]|nr:hypothetical protein LB506_010047 [Fusarium annulatum]